jgi:type I restriction-modification system DNA methylase subunit
MARSRPAAKSKNSANIGFEAKLCFAADKLRTNMDAAEYKHVVLGLIFLKYISDSFEEPHANLMAGEGDYPGDNPEDPDEYRAMMNLAVRAIEADLGKEQADTLRRDLHPDLRADFELALQRLRLVPQRRRRGIHLVGSHVIA